MILMNRKRKSIGNCQLTIANWQRLTIICLLTFIFFNSCGVYTFHDVSVDYSKIKTARVGFIDNKARYINPQLSPKVTDALKQKINSYTKLTLTNSDDANYQISGYISRYDVTTSAISSNQSVTNR